VNISANVRSFVADQVAPIQSSISGQVLGSPRLDTMQRGAGIPPLFEIAAWSAATIAGGVIIGAMVAATTGIPIAMALGAAVTATGAYAVYKQYFVI
jgi:hypothetical protein